MSRLDWRRARVFRETESIRDELPRGDYLARRADKAMRRWPGRHIPLIAADIERGKSPRGGWTRATLAKWGVPWPPPKGWKKRLLGEGAA